MGYPFVSLTEDDNNQIGDVKYTRPFSVTSSAFSVPTPKVLDVVDSLQSETSQSKGTKYTTRIIMSK